MNIYEKILSNKDKTFSIDRYVNKPINLNRRDIVNIIQYHKNDYLLAAKADGIRCLLLIYNNQLYKVMNRCVVFVSKIDINNMIIDGELINETYIAFDILYMDNYNYLLSKRLEYLHMISNKIPYIIVRELFRLDELKKVKCEFRCDGIIFVPIKDNLITYKWKPIEKLTIDFQVKKYEDKLILCVSNEKGVKGFRINNMLYSVKGFKEDDIVECRYENDNFIPIRLRKDRIYPNYKDIALSIFDNIKDYFTLDQYL